jgi:hypothetical protein
MDHSEAGYDEKADIWSFGITAMELAYGRAPYARLHPMKVMVKTIQEDPPTCELYNDNSYMFSSNFKEMIAKCLRKDPQRRPNVTKLLKHKFFKQSKDKNYLVQKIIAKLPKKLYSDNEKPIDLVTLRRKCSGAATDSGLVSVSSWVFDDEELDEVKRQACMIDQRGFYDEEAPTPRSTAGHLPKSMSISSLDTCVNPGSFMKWAPSASTQRSSLPTSTSIHQLNNIRSPPDHDSSSDISTDEDDDEKHPMPDFSDPNDVPNYVGPGPITPNLFGTPVQPTLSVPLYPSTGYITSPLRNNSPIIHHPSTHTPSPGTSSSNSLSPSPTAVSPFPSSNMMPNPSPASSTITPSPNVHFQGRFLVADQEDESFPEYNQPISNPSDFSGSRFQISNDIPDDNEHIGDLTAEEITDEEFARVSSQMGRFNISEQ